MWPAEPGGIGLYIHIPFCLRRCGYCGFFSQDDASSYKTRYLAALRQQIRDVAAEYGRDGLRITTVFFGGGTPTVLPPARLASLLAEIRSSLRVDAQAEISIEINPATIDRSGLRQLRRAGFNRLSIGIQSLADQELARLGRAHNAAQALDAVRDGRAAGFGNLNLDLMYGLPGQDLASWQDTLSQALSLHPEHLSVYELTIEPDTPFAALRAADRLDLPDEESVLRMHGLALELTRRVGLPRYEISNYARPAHRCRHNLNYWHNGPYLGLGAGAVSFLGGRRQRAVASIREYCRRIEENMPPWEEEETLDREGRFRETVIMGLRLIQGIDPERLRARFNLDVREYYGKTMEKLLVQGLLTDSGGRLRLTGQGLLLANRVMAELV